VAVRRTHVGLLRGVNVLGRNKVSMPELRQLVESLGHGDVVTYIQSGNVVFTVRGRLDDGRIERDIERAIAAATGVRPAVVVVRVAELARVIRANPFPNVSEPRLLHAVFLPRRPDKAGLASVAAAVERSRAKGSRDEATVIGRVLYLHTPDGFGPSVLRRELDRRGANRSPLADGTARNWRTVTALAELTGASGN